MLGDSQAVSESSNTPHCHIVFVNVGQVKKSGEQLRNACVSDMKFEVPVSDERLESNYKKHSKIPDVLWEDIGGLEHVREEIMDAITLPMMHGDLFKQGGGAGGLACYCSARREQGKPWLPRRLQRSASEIGQRMKLRLERRDSKSNVLHI